MIKIKCLFITNASTQVTFDLKTKLSIFLNCLLLLFKKHLGIFN